MNAASLDLFLLEDTVWIACAETGLSTYDFPFLVVDVAQTAEGKWIAIERNDGQESGYASVPPIALWNNLIEVERKT
jgi:hypothetical protein